MSNVNKAIIIGRAGRDPETRYMANGNAVTNLSLATSETWKDKASGERKEATEWHRLVFFDRLAEIAGEYVKKGRPIYIEGRLKYGKYTDQSGVERNTVDIIATELQLLGGREGMGGGDRGGMEEGGERPAYTPRAAAPAARPAMAARPAPTPRPAPAPAAAPTHSGFEDMDDDVPF